MKNVKLPIALSSLTLLLLIGSINSSQAQQTNIKHQEQSDFDPRDDGPNDLPNPGLGEATYVEKQLEGESTSQSPKTYSSNGNIYVDMPEQRGKSVPMIRLVNMSGQVVWEEPLQFGFNVLNSTNLPKGTYIYQIDQGNGNFQIDKIVIG